VILDRVATLSGSWTSAVETLKALVVVQDDEVNGIVWAYWAENFTY
jgi:hypothetical protein